VSKINLYLDDMRPAPEGWVLVKTVAEAQEVIKLHNVQLMSLDHDLGACLDCYLKAGVLLPDGFDFSDLESLEMAQNEWLEADSYRSMPNCEHFGTGYQLVLWMAESDLWPAVKPNVHSANSVGRENMKAVIDRYYQAPLWPLIIDLEKACWTRKWSAAKKARKALEERLGQKRPKGTVIDGEEADWVEGEDSV
jgi:hypothetical protein